MKTGRRATAAPLSQKLLLRAGFPIFFIKLYKIVGVTIKGRRVYWQENVICQKKYWKP
jgi:hypothetical protein